MNIQSAVLVARPEPGEERAAKIALLGVTVEAEVRDVAVHLTLTQVYRNDEDRPIEALYCFPIDEGAAVCGFRIETGGRLINGVAEEKERAFELYDKAIERGDGAFLADQENEDILTVSVGNLKPGQEVRVQVRTVSELPVADGIMRLTVPTSVSPRYAPAGADPAHVDRITPDYVSEVPYRLSLQVRVLAEAVRAARSPSHRVVEAREGGWTVVRLADGSMPLDRDFVLELERASARGAVSYLSRHANGERALLLRFYPELETPAGAAERGATAKVETGVEQASASEPGATRQGAVPSRSAPRSEVAFLLDCSGSMQGSSIHEALQALDLSLRSLEEGDLFNIVRFGSRFEAWQKAPVVYDRRTLDQALRYLRGLNADLGGTELFPALKFVCGTRPAEGTRREVVLLTDGEVSNPDQVIRLARAAAAHTRIFSFGIGYGASHALVKGVARATGGAWEMIHPGEKVQPKVLRQLSRLTQPCLEEVRVDLPGGKIELSGPLPPVFEGDSVTVFARVLEMGRAAEARAAGAANEGPTVCFTGSLEGHTYSWSAPVIDTGEDDAVPCLWARARIKELKAGMEEGAGSNQGARRMKSVLRQITELGKSFCLLTDFTSFVAVEERAAGERTAGQPEYRRIPVLLTHDYGGIEQPVMADRHWLGGRASAPVYRAVLPLGKADENIIKARRSVGNFFGAISSERRAVYTGHDVLEQREIEPVEWYLELLATQQAEGWFEGWEVPASRLGITGKELEERALEMAEGWGLPEGVPPEDRARLLVTWLAIRLLAEDSEAAAAGRRARVKARKWLERALRTCGLEPERIASLLDAAPSVPVAQMLPKI